MRPCQHCGRAIGVKQSRCPHCAHEQSATVGFDVAPRSAPDFSGPGTHHVLDDDDASLIAACRLAPFVIMLPGGFFGYIAAGISGMMIGSFLTLLCALIVIFAAIGGGT